MPVSSVVPLSTPSPYNLEPPQDFVHLIQMYHGSRACTTEEAKERSRTAGSKFIWRPNGLDLCIELLGGES